MIQALWFMWRNPYSTKIMGLAMDVVKLKQPGLL